MANNKNSSENLFGYLKKIGHLGKAVYLEGVRSSSDQEIAVKKLREKGIRIDAKNLTFLNALICGFGGSLEHYLEGDKAHGLLRGLENAIFSGTADLLNVSVQSIFYSWAIYNIGIIVCECHLLLHEIV